MTTAWDSKLFKIIMRTRFKFLKNYNPWTDKIQTSLQEPQKKEQAQSPIRQRRRKIKLKGYESQDDSTESSNSYFKDDLNDLLDKTYKNESTSLTKDKKNLIKQYIKNLLT